MLRREFGSLAALSSRPPWPSLIMHDKASLLTDLHALGLQPGDDVMVHSSYKSLGGVVGGPAAVVEALLEVVGPHGTLLLPTFTHSGTTHFDPRTTPSRNGAITDVYLFVPLCVSRPPLQFHQWASHSRADHTLDSSHSLPQLSI